MERALCIVMSRSQLISRPPSIPQKRRPRGLLHFAAQYVLFACTVGCAPFAEDDVREQARSDLGCQDVTTKFLDTRGRRQYWLVEGCGRVSHYECRHDGFDVYDCRRIGERELPRPELSSF